ncbi:hypothetical protein BCR44DRAFT_1433748, partial [Catenaria anguillulae PL171]
MHVARSRRSSLDWATTSFERRSGKWAAVKREFDGKAAQCCWWGGRGRTAAAGERQQQPVI